MPTQEHNSALLDLLPDTIIELFEVDLGEQDGIYRFHGGSISYEPLFFAGKPYFPLPMDASGFEKRSDGQLPRPVITFANPDGLISDVLKGRDDLVGKAITRKRVFLKFLDSSNFPSNHNPFAFPDPNSRFDDDVYFVNRKTEENKFFVEFELSSPLEFEDVKIPTRHMIANYCPWKFRGAGCRFGQRSDFLDPELTVNNDNFSKKKPSNVFVSGSNQLGDLGLPLADENDKLFWEENGYGLESMTWRGDYDRTTNDYVTGDIVRIKSKFSNLSKLELVDPDEDMIDEPDLFFVCIKNAPINKDPRYEKEYWAQDQCSKSMNGCQIRYRLYGEYKRGLPYGGFPSIEAFRFR